MRPILTAAALGGALMACAPAQEPAPRAASLSAAMLTVTLNDGQRCRGPRPEGAGPQGWSGTLEGCAVAYPYEVRLAPKVNPLRGAVEAVATALSFDDQLAAMADVTVTGPDGRVHRFTSPPPPDR